MEFHSENKTSFKIGIADISGDEYQILIFCTSLRNGSDVQKITPLLTALPEIISWTVDLEDVDKVLRVVCRGLDENRISSVLHDSSYTCWPMPD